MELRTGLVEPSTVGPRVEQVGWGVARQVARRLAEQVGPDPLLERVPDLAETAGCAAYAVFEGRDAVALGLLRLAGRRASYDGHVLGPAAPAATVEALLVRCLHDAGAAGARVLAVPWTEVGGGGLLTGWPVVNDQ